jgi:cytochrome c-type biogenesis protein CcmE
MSVTTAKRDAAQLGQQPVAVRGTVDAASIVLNGTLVESFIIEDGSEKLLVQYRQPPPENFGPKDVVVNGRVQRTEDGSIVLLADSIQVGCSSKY